MLKRLEEESLNDFLLKNQKEYARCVNKSCIQILKLEQKKYPDGTIALVGECDICSIKYCISCSNEFNEPIQEHYYNLSCKQAKDNADINLIIKKHVLAITDLLTLKCPRCKTPFFDFDGCCALTCCNESCRAGFCALCQEDCGDDAHSHVRTCRLGKSSYFLSEECIIKAQNQRKCERINEYISNEIKDKAIKTEVLNLTRQYLNDINYTW